MPVKKKMKKSRNYILIAISILSVLPLLFTTLMGLPNTDDFITWVPLAGSHKPLGEYFKSVMAEYVSWQGTYTSAFLRQIPIYKMAGLVGVRIEYFLITVLFLFTLGHLFVLLGKKNGFTKNQIWFLIMLSSLFLFDSSYLHELFYWHTGIAGYTVPLILGLVAIILFINSSRTSHIAGGCICAFLAAGGALIITAIICAVLLLLIIIELLEKEKTLKWENKYLIFTAAVLGGIINAAAPGNYNRASNFSEHISVIHSLAGTLARIHVVLKTGIMDVMVPTIALVVFVYAYHKARENDFKCRYPWIIAFAGYLVLVITDFPVMLGYGIGVDTELAMPGRCCFVERLAFLIVTIVVAWYIGTYVGKCADIHLEKEWFALCGILVAIALYIVVSPSEVVQLRMAKNLVSSNTRQWINLQEDILDEAEHNPNSKLCFEVGGDLIPDDIYVPKLNLNGSMDSMGNMYIANFFGKDEVLLIEK